MLVPWQVRRPLLASLLPRSLHWRPQGLEVITQGQACCSATQHWTWRPREGLLVFADTLPKGCVELAGLRRCPSPQHSRPAVALPCSFPTESLISPGASWNQSSPLSLPSLSPSLDLPAEGQGRLAGAVQELQARGLRLFSGPLGRAVEEESQLLPSQSSLGGSVCSPELVFGPVQGVTSTCHFPGSFLVSIQSRVLYSPTERNQHFTGELCTCPSA